MPALLERTVSYDSTEIDSELCRLSFWDFVQQFWEFVPGAGKMVVNWHMEYLCHQLQQLAERVFRGERKLHDVVINIPPGTSKSTICSILFPAWLWTRMPSCRVMTASHTDSLVMDLANKSRAVIKSERYRAFFPEIELRDDQAAKSYFANSLGGDRYTCTVAGKSPMGFHAHIILIDDPLDPKKVLSEAEVKTAKEFMTDVISTRKVDKAVTVTVLIMQRLGLGDPTEVMLDAAKVEGAAKVFHVCLPAELTESVSPPELKKKYRDNLLDVKRLDAGVLSEFKAKGAHFYSTQFLQRPYSKEGGMFHEEWFNHRVKAAPYVARRIRYWDRASTEGGGAGTAGTLIAEANGSFFIEHCVQGHWGPDERNQKMRATALRDRARYGPKHEPQIKVEAEGGSSGRDAWKMVARALAGFAVFEDRVTGDKETRAEPWAAQLAAGNVYVVDNGESEGGGKADWDIEAYVREHCAFPLGNLKDRVDSSSGGFNNLVGSPHSSGGFRVLPRLGAGHSKGLKIVVCSREELANIVITDHRTLLVSIHNPADDAPDKPIHGLDKLLDWLPLNFPNLNPAELQEHWDEPVVPWNKLPAELVMNREHGKKLWSFLLKKREPTPEVWVLCDDGDGRALSVAIGLCDTLKLKKSETLHRPGHDTVVEEPGNRHVYDVVKSSRHMVM